MKSKLYPIFSIILVLTLVLSCAGGARTGTAVQGRSTELVPIMANARTGVLSSGLRYYLLDNTMPEGRALLTLVVDAGSVLEAENERGLAHFVEHMAFNGTLNFPKFDLINYLRSLGMRFGPDVNARTSFDYTIYDIEVPTELDSAGNRRIPERAFSIIDDWTWALTFDPEEFDNERLVIIEEYRFRMGARERINRQIFPVLLRDSRYADRLPIGSLEVLETAPVETLINFYQRWYRPENMAIIIVGDYDVDLLEQELEIHFPARDLPGSDTPFNRTRYDLRTPVSGSLESLVVTDPEETQTWVELYWQRDPQIRRPDMAAYRESVINYLMEIMLSLRFQEEIIKLETPYETAGAGVFNFAYSSSFFYLSARAKTGRSEESLAEMLLVKESLERFGFLQEEVDEAKVFLLSMLEQMVQEENRRQSSQFIRQFTQHFLEGLPVPDISWEFETIRNMLPGISLDEINRTVRNNFANDDLTILIMAPDSEIDSLPGNDRIRALAAAVRNAYIAPPSRAAIEGELLDYVPTAGSIVRESVDGETGATVWNLSNGAEVILRESRNTNNQVTFYAVARGGTLSASDDAAVSAALASNMLAVSGLGNFNQPDLTRLLLDKQVSLSFFAQNFLRGFDGTSTVQDIETLFQMLYLNFTQPRFDPEAINVLLSQLRSRLLLQENDPNSFFGREANRIINGNPRFHPLVAEDIDRVNLNDAMAFIQAGLNPADYTFVFVGNMDIEYLRPFVERYIASIPAGQNLNTYANQNPQRPSNTERNFYMGSDERSIIELIWFRDIEFTEANNASVSVLSNYLEIVVNDLVRERLGGVYAIQGWASLSAVPRGELLGGVYFVTDPNRVEELVQAVLAELRSIAAGNIDEEIFRQAIEAMVMEHDVLVQRDNLIAQSYANSRQIFNSPLSRQDRRPSYYRAVTMSDMQRMMSEMLLGSYVRLVLYPEQ